MDPGLYWMRRISDGEITVAELAYSVDSGDRDLEARLATIERRKQTYPDEDGSWYMRTVWYWPGTEQEDQGPDPPNGWEILGPAECPYEVKP